MQNMPPWKNFSWGNFSTSFKKLSQEQKTHFCKLSVNIRREFEEKRQHGTQAKALHVLPQEVLNSQANIPKGISTHRYGQLAGHAGVMPDQNPLVG